MRVIGTAGHVDHGKSSLVEALTGIHPDRLKEERERQMTIDLGFAWLTFPNGEAVGVVDVPGHRDFIENMLAGVGGLDAVLFVIAADEGVMPQTREHLAILDLLEVPAGIIVLSKVDLVDDDWLPLVKADVNAVVRGTVLADAPLVAVSTRTGQGLDALRQALQSTLARRPPRRDIGRPRLPIDRAFTLAGFGTIVTGTLIDGSLQIGDEVEVLPDGIVARIRGLQSHKAKVERAQPGSRVAINLAGVDLSQIHRGMVVARPGSLQTSPWLDLRLRQLPDAALPLKHNDDVKFFMGSAEVRGTVRLLDQNAIMPGEQGWAQLTLDVPVAAVKGDHFILRRPSPGETIGGGVIVDPHPKRRHRRHDPAVIARLETLARGNPGDVLLQALDGLGPASAREALEASGLHGPAADEAMAESRRTGQLVALDGDSLLASQAAWRRIEAGLVSALAAYHAAHPLRSGMPREELKNRVSQAVDAQWRPRLTAKVFNAVITHASVIGLVMSSGAHLRLAAHAVMLTPAQTALVEVVLADFERDPYNTPSYKDCAARLGDELLTAIIDQGRLVAVSPEVLFSAAGYSALLAGIKQRLHSRGPVTVAEVRDMFATSRKYALAMLEHLDAVGVTRRDGDERVLKSA